MNKPSIKPGNPNFSSGPCSKHPEYNLSQLRTDTLGRSHRSSLGKARLKELIDLSRELLDIPNDYLVGIVPASDTGAVEMALWGMLGHNPVTVCYWESFGKGWMTDLTKELNIEHLTKLEADYGKLPDFSQIKDDNDIIFTWNGTTSGAKVPNADWVSNNRTGITICDATSAVFAMEMPWHKLDVTTYSWQKVLGGEGGHGMLILSPRAVKRLENFDTVRPLPKIFRLLKDGKINSSIFEGATINTPSMLAVEDCLDALYWVKRIGGRAKTIARSEANLATVTSFVEKNTWISFLTAQKEQRSNTSVCLKLDLDNDKIKKLIKLLADEEVGYDLGAYRDAPAGLRIWCGATIETSDIEALLPWLEWAYHKVK